jgi:hypothetical protein
MVMASLRKDFRLVQRHFQKQFKMFDGGDAALNSIGLFLVVSMFATVVVQKDISKEAIENWSPFRFQNPQSVWHGAYVEVQKLITKPK